MYLRLMVPMLQRGNLLQNASAFRTRSVPGDVPTQERGHDQKYRAPERGAGPSQ